MKKVTLFSGFNQPVEDLDLLTILQDVQNGKYRADIESIRSLLMSNDFSKADHLKRQLPAFTPSATYSGGRKTEFISDYSGFIHLDFDKLNPDQLSSGYIRITQSPYTFACFLSPGGKGFKVFVQVDTGLDRHDIAYKNVLDHFEQITLLKCDPKCKDVTRLCFVSYDPNCFINPNNQIFEVSDVKSKDNKNFEEDSGQTDYIDIFEECIQFTDQKEKYFEGNRNNYIFQLACNCNRNGIPEHLCIDYILSHFDLPDSEIRSAVKSAYLNHTAEFANFATSAKSKTGLPPLEDYLKKSPVIADDIIEKLPDILKSGACLFNDRRERDVFITGALAILSGCMPNVKGVYSQESVYPNLFAFIIAPAASGKGVLKFAKCLGDKYHTNILTKSREDQQRYDIELNQFKSLKRSKNSKEPYEEPPVPPVFRVLFIPANTSYAKILWHIEQNQGQGIICETEADTMSNVMDKEWGGYSDLMRKAFHHERISSSKKANNEYIEVDMPRLSVVLSGTPSQVTGLIASADDGLFSRFMFYAYKVDQEWKDVSPQASRINLTDHFSGLSTQVNDMMEFLENWPTEVVLSPDQWQVLNNTFKMWLKETTSFDSEESGGVVKRLGLIAYRITMIFTALRKFEANDNSERMQCLDDDFIIAIRLIGMYLNHSLLMFYNLPHNSKNEVFLSGDNKRKFFDALPKEFKRAEAIEIGRKFDLSTRSVDALLRDLDKKLLESPRHGYYVKI